MANHTLDDMNNMLKATGRMTNDAGTAHRSIRGINQGFDGMAETSKAPGQRLVIALGEQYV